VSALAGGVVGLALVVIGALHVLWVYSPWPCRTRDELARNVVGRPTGDLPAIFAPLSVLVAALLVAAAHVVAATAGIVPSFLPDVVVSVGAAGVAVVLGTRGVAGLAQSGLGLGEAPARYRHLDVRVYSPLCLALTALVLVVIVSGS
jgi:hypothetical protein